MGTGNLGNIGVLNLSGSTSTNTHRNDGLLDMGLGGGDLSGGGNLQSGIHGGLDNNDLLSLI